MPDDSQNSNPTTGSSSVNPPVANQPPPDVNPSAVTYQTSSKFPKKNIIATLLGIFVLLGGVMVGVFLVGQQQDIGNKAAGDVCSLASENCITIENPEDSGSYQVDGIIYNVYLTDKQVRAFDPSVTQDGCYQVLIEGDTIYWNAVYWIWIRL